MVFRGPHRICEAPSAGCAEIALEGTISADAAVGGVKLVGRTVRRMAPVEGVRVGRRGMRVVKVLREVRSDHAED